MAKQPYQNILAFWFGDPNLIDMPTAERTTLWFGIDNKTDRLVKDNFGTITNAVMQGKYSAWAAIPHGRLALIIILDQFIPRLFRGDPTAFAYEQHALDLCLDGMRNELDQHLSLMERAFFYMPMVHMEDCDIQKQALFAYETLVALSMPELSTIFQAFYDYAHEHYKLIVKFARFPQRNELLGRTSTPDEIIFLEKMRLDDE